MRFLALGDSYTIGEGVDADEDESTAPSSGGGTTVIPWKAADIHAESSEGSAVLGRLEAKQRYAASCWVVGETVSSDGYTGDRWVEVTNGRLTGFVSGVFLKGNATGGVSERCDD